MPKKARRAISAALAFLALSTGACAGQPAWGSVVDAAGERQRVLCRGTTGPAVVVVHGIGDHAGSSSFTKVLDELPADRRVCRYDRPGAGDSPPPSRGGRDAVQLVKELDSVVQLADSDQPVLLVGHSFGSYPVLLYTVQHRDRVSGVILVDGVDPQLGLLSALGATSWTKVSMAAEDLDLPAVQDQTASAVADGKPTFAALPLTVIRREKNVTSTWLEAQQHLAGLSNSGRIVVASDAGHQVPEDNPVAVADAITHFQY
jgi:pimeloyl-ACP methyl ester carboxylesterase